MGFFDLANHLFNFVLPAIVMGVLMPLFSRLIWHKVTVKRTLKSQMLITGLACLAVLVAGLVIFSTEGKMATYISMMVVASVCQWWYQGWQA